MVRYVSVVPFNGLSYCFFSPLYRLKQFVMADISKKHPPPLSNSDQMTQMDFTSNS